MTTWDASLETGDAVIDWQHRELFAIVDDLRAACEQGRAEHRVDLILDRTMFYATNHFAAEEKLMESRGYDLGEALFHQRDHIRLKQHVAGLVERRRRGDLNSITPVAHLLEEWLRVHIHQVDRKFVDAVRV